MPSSRVPTRAAEPPTLRSAPEPVRITGTFVPPRAPITALADVPIGPSELVAVNSEGTPTMIPLPEQPMGSPAQHTPAAAVPETSPAEAQIRSVAPVPVAATPIPPPTEARTPLPANNLGPCLDHASSAETADVQLPNVEMPETEGHGVTGPTEDFLCVPAGLMLPTLAFGEPPVDEPPAQPVADPSTLGAD